MNPVRLFAGLGVLVAVALIVALVASDRGSSDDPSGDREVAFVNRADPGCDVGSASPVKAPRVGGVITMRTRPLIFACGSSSSPGRFDIVGFDTNHGICVAVDGIEQGKTYGAICRDPRTPWLDFCQGGPGCVLRSEEGAAFTLILGLIGGQVKGIRASVEGSREIGDVALARVDDGLLEQLHRKEPFGLFAVALPGCVPIDLVRLEMLDAKGAGMGVARETGGLPSTCK